MLSERKQAQKVIYCMNYLYKMSRYANLQRKNQLSKAGGKDKWGDSESLIMDMKFSFWGGENVLEFNSDNACVTL